MTTPTPKEIEAMAKAIAFTELTPKGVAQCRWPSDWSDADANKYRLMAHAAANALAAVDENGRKG
jgi:hypothetical protein